MSHNVRCLFKKNKNRELSEVILHNDIRILPKYYLFKYSYILILFFNMDLAMIFTKKYFIFTFYFFCKKILFIN